MPFDLHNPPPPLIYLITSGQTTERTTPDGEAFGAVLQLIQAAVNAQVDLVQIREKSLSGRVLYQLALGAVNITKNSATKLLVNDRSDIAAAANADGVHLTTTSLSTAVVRRSFGEHFIIGVSTHSLEAASLARREGANFVVFGPVFAIVSKREYGEPLGLTRLAQVCAALSPFPVIALGGVTKRNAAECFSAGAQGIAAIRELAQPELLAGIVSEIRRSFATG
ncbi:MAG TPA: thiamine phosphate synthase [Pyrinomonadaceae bacterium]|jgi:thiamine-phosphate pyrophosphorylase|nr:thiamine phosphate synthase [Pyrinomonadaceae bacterium]